MPRFFTHYWNNETWDWNQGSDDGPCEHTAGNLFRKRGIGRQDFIYIVTVKAGQLYLGGRMQVHDVISRDQAIERLAHENLWEAKDHAIAIPGSGSPMKYDRILSLEAVKLLRFVTGKGEEGLCFRTTTELDSQTLRGVRELTPESARILDALIGCSMTNSEKQDFSVDGKGVDHQSGDSVKESLVGSDFVFDPSNIDDERMRRRQDVVQRLGQSTFRQALLLAYNGRCALSGYGVEKALQAAHIIPFKGEVTNHISNGLLLRADLHNLFDSYLLSIDPETLTVCVALGLRDTPYGDLSGRKVTLPKDKSIWPNRQALEHHFYFFSSYELGRNDFTDEGLDRARNDPLKFTTAEVIDYLHSL